MKARLLITFVSLLAIASLAQLAGWKKAEKIEGDPLGFLDPSRPFGVWQWNPDPEHRMEGSVSNLVVWGNIQSIQVLDTKLAIQGSGDIEEYIKHVLTDKEFLKTVPANKRFEPDDEDKQLSLQAILKLKDGTYALLSITDSWAIIERDRKLGLFYGWSRL
jgi:hypothetical protein